MTWAGRVRARRYRARTAERAKIYAAFPTDAERHAHQLDRFHTEWRRIVASVPYFRKLQQDLQLPTRFESWTEFAERLPPMTKQTIREQGNALASEERPPDALQITGGSTAQPIQLPAWNDEISHTTPDIWVARARYGIDPGSSLFLVWGHSHLLGTGLRGWFNGQLRRGRDRLLGYTRFSAYDLRADSLRRAADEMLRVRPEYVMGYSVALDRFARANEDRAEALKALGLKVVIGTAERFPAADSSERLSSLFGCPVAMEYGAVETGLIAHTLPSGGYEAFWNSYFIEADREEGAFTIRLTALYPRCVPLIRYEIGDQIQLSAGAPDRVLGVTSFERVVGRCNEYVDMPDGSQIHSEAFTHAVRSCPQIESYQVVDSGSGTTICFVADSDLDDVTRAEVRARLGKIHPSLSDVGLERVDALRQTIAGKTLMVIKS